MVVVSRSTISEAILTNHFDNTVPFVKVSKSQIVVFIETPLPPKKRPKYLKEFCPIFIGQNFVKYIVHFLGIEVKKKMLLRFTDL